MTISIALDIDGTITESIEFFRIMTHRLILGHRIVLLTNRGPGTEQQVADEIDDLGIDYSEIVITSDKAQYIKDNNITIFFENEDEYFLEIPESVTVFKIREDGNFSFAEKKWITSRKNSILIDD
jgi:uncharacterized HAD superfamily protein